MPVGVSFLQAAIKGGMVMKRTKLILAVIVLCICGSMADAQVSFEEAQRKLVELKAGNFKEAIATSNAFQATLRRPIGKLNDPNWIDSLHIQAVAHMKLG